MRKKARGFARPTGAPPAVKPSYEVPKWAGKPPAGMHLDVMKDGKLIEKFILDGKTHFFFGRQKEYIDFTIDHNSCSRAHAVIVYHKQLQRMFIVDLGSTHGTFLGSIRLEANHPMQLPIDEVFSFGASTRTWMLREKPNAIDTSLNSSVNENTESDSNNVSLLGLPEAEHELNDLTEFNTAHNRRLATLPIDDSNNLISRKRRRSSHGVSFSEEDTIINPEDVDPTIGRFRNLISTEIIIPNKQRKLSSNSDHENTDARITKTQQDFQTNNLYSDITPDSSINAGLKISSAPDVEEPDVFFKRAVVTNIPQVTRITPIETIERNSQEPHKKKYMKEAWPGRKPKAQNLLSV